MVAVQLRQQQRNVKTKKISCLIYFLNCYLCWKIATLLEIIITLSLSRLTTRIKGRQKPTVCIMLGDENSFECNRKNHSDWPNSPEGPDPLRWVGKTSCGPWRSGWAWSILKVSSWPPAPHSRPGPRLTCSFPRWSPWTERGGRCKRKVNACLNSTGHDWAGYISSWELLFICGKSNRGGKKTVKHLARYGLHT